MKSAVAFILVLCVFAALFARPCQASLEDIVDKTGAITGKLGEGLSKDVRNVAGDVSGAIGGTGGLAGGTIIGNKGNSSTTEGN